MALSRTLGLLISTALVISCKAKDDAARPAAPAGSGGRVVPEGEGEGEGENEVDSPVTDFSIDDPLRPSPCSPVAPGDAAEGVFINIPGERVWGEPLPVCGLLRFPRDRVRPAPSSRFAVHIRAAGSEEFVRDSANYRLGSPRLSDNEALLDALHERGESHFNAYAVNEYTVLAPGSYDVSVRFFNLESARARLVVHPGGWREELARFLVQGYCEGSLAADFKDYLEIQHTLNTADMDEAAAQEATAELHAAGERAYTSYRSAIKPDWATGFRSEHPRDGVVPTYTVALAKQTCPQGRDANDLFYIYEGLKRVAAQR